MCGRMDCVRRAIREWAGAVDGRECCGQEKYTCGLSDWIDLDRAANRAADQQSATRRRASREFASDGNGAAGLKD